MTVIRAAHGDQDIHLRRLSMVRNGMVRRCMMRSRVMRGGSLGQSGLPFSQTQDDSKQERPFQANSPMGKESGTGRAMNWGHGFNPFSSTTEISSVRQQSFHEG